MLNLIEYYYILSKFKKYGIYNFWKHPTIFLMYVTVLINPMCYISCVTKLNTNIFCMFSPETLYIQKLLSATIGLICVRRFDTSRIAASNVKNPQVNCKRVLGSCTACTIFSLGSPLMSRQGSVWFGAIVSTRSGRHNSRSLFTHVLFIILRPHSSIVMSIINVLIYYWERGIICMIMSV